MKKSSLSALVASALLAVAAQSQAMVNDSVTAVSIPFVTVDGGGGGIGGTGKKVVDGGGIGGTGKKVADGGGIGGTGKKAVAA